jgi:thymidine kinase
MFIEPGLHPSGWIEVICGGMFSGKTEELIRRIKRAKIAGQAVLLFKPDLDKRYHADHVVSHDENVFVSTPVAHAADIIPLAASGYVIGIDEAQFFDADIVQVCNALADGGKRVIVAGLDMDYKGDPFGPVPQLLAEAEYITKVHAICVICGSIASYSYRRVTDDDTILLGAGEKYEPRCRVCFNK